MMFTMTMTMMMIQGKPFSWEIFCNSASRRQFHLAMAAPLPLQEGVGWVVADCCYHHCDACYRPSIDPFAVRTEPNGSDMAQHGDDVTVWNVASSL